MSTVEKIEPSGHSTDRGRHVTTTFLQWMYMRSVVHRGYILTSGLYFVVTAHLSASQLVLLFRWFKIERHILVRGTASPDDPRLREYWTRRRAAQAKDLRPSLQKIAKNQSYVCSVCGETLFNDEEIHTHHLEPRAQGGRDGYTNLALTHLYCHQQIHSGETEIIGGPTH